MQQQKLRLFEEVLFELKDGSTEQTFAPKHPKLRRVIFGLINTFAHDDFKEMELLNSAVTIAWETLDKFLLPNGANWDAIDAHNLNRIVKAITTKLEHELPAIANLNTKRMYDPETGGKMYVTINFESLDRPIYDENGFIIGSLGDEVTESFFSPSYSYSKNPFVVWFRENRNEFLTRRQNEFIDGLSTGLLSKDADYVDENDFETLADMKTNDLDHMKKRIRERTLKAWEAHKAGKPELTRRGAYLTGKIAQWNEFIAIADSGDSLEDQNVRLSEWLMAQERERGDDAVDFVYDTLADDITATKAFASFMKGECESIGASVLYRIYDAVEKEVVRLSHEVASLPTQPVTRGTDLKKRARNTERKRKYKAFTEEQPCYVYNRDGEMTGVIKADLKPYKVVELNAFGMTQDMREI